MAALAIVAALVALAVMMLGGSHRPGLLEGTARTTIASFADGTAARVVGVVQPCETITAPLTGRACVLYEVEVIEFVRRGRSTHAQRVLLERRSVPFTIEDDTGGASVEIGERAELDLAGEWKLHVDPLHASRTPAQEALLARAGYHRSDRVLPYREVILEVGATVAVHGLGSRSPDPAGAPAGGYRDAPATRLRITAAPHTPVTLSDDPDARR